MGALARGGQPSSTVSRAFKEWPTLLHVSFEHFRARGMPLNREQLRATIGTTLLAACVAFTPTNVVFRYAFTGPALTIESSMACRVFRAVALRSTTFAKDIESDETLSMTTFTYQEQPSTLDNIHTFSSQRHSRVWQ